MLVKLQNTSKPQNPFVFLTDQRWRAVQQKWSAYQAEKKTDKWAEQGHV